MKFIRLSLLAASISGLLLFSACGGGGDPEKPIEQVQLGLLSKTWNLTEAKLGNVVSTDYVNSQLTIDGTFNNVPGTEYNFTLTGLPTAAGKKVPWPRTANSPTTGMKKWKFSEDEPETTIIRVEDGLAITYTVTQTTLVLFFNYTGAGYRTSSVEGDWQFTFQTTP
jgi:hypothetical protein